MWEQRKPDYKTSMSTSMSFKNNAPFPQDNIQRTLSRLISDGEFEKALAYFIENREQLPFFRQRFYFACIQDGLENHKTYRRVVHTAILMIVVNLLIQPFFFIRLLDVFSFLSQTFLFYNYASALVVPLLNVFFIISLLVKWHTWVALPVRLFGRTVQPFYRACFFTLIVLASAYSAWQLNPLLQDLPMALEGRYMARHISREEHTVMVLGGIIRTTPRADMREYLRRRLHNEYGWDYDNTDYPAHFFRRERRMRGEVNLIDVGEGEPFIMSEMQLNATLFDRQFRTFPIIIKFLPNSRIILQIANE